MKRATPLLAALLLAALVLAACTGLPPATPDGAATESPAADPAGAIEASARQGGFELVVRADRAVYVANDPIRVEAALAPVGRGRRAEVSGSSTLVAFALQQLDGSRRMTPVSTADCARRVLSGEAPLVAPFTKSGSPSSDPANEPFWSEFFSQPDLRLPAGTWRIEGIATFHVGPDCTGRPIEIRVPLDVVVEP